MSKSPHLKVIFKKGFTLLEVLTAAAIAFVLLTALYTTFVAGTRSYRSTVNQAELAQNGRIALERISRDIRQTDEIVTTIPPTKDDLLNPPPNKILFQDGHSTTSIRYIEYRQDGNLLKRRTLHYSFSSSPSTWVLWNAQDQFNNPPTEHQDSEEIKADKISSLKFYGSNIVTIDLVINGSNQTIYLKTEALARNI